MFWIPQPYNATLQQSIFKIAQTYMRLTFSPCRKKLTNKINPLKIPLISLHTLYCRKEKTDKGDVNMLKDVQKGVCYYVHKAKA